MGKCLICGSADGESLICPHCGFDKSKNYCEYLSLTTLMEEELPTPVLHEKDNKNSQVWTEWLASVSEDIDALDAYDANEIFVKVKQYYRSLVLDLNHKKQVDNKTSQVSNARSSLFANEKEKSLFHTSKIENKTGWTNLNIQSTSQIMMDEERTMKKTKGDMEKYFNNLTIKLPNL